MPITVSKTGFTEEKAHEFTEENVNKSPDKHGIYALFDRGELIYIGRADGKDVTIRSRLQSHLRGDEGSCTEEATHYMRDVTEDAKTREAELLVDYERIYNGKLPRCNEVIP